MIYQGTAYNYNQRGEVVLPTRRGTNYYQPQNHKPFIVYTGLDVDLEFFVSNSDRKPADISNKTFTAQIVDRNSRSVRVNRTLVPLDYSKGSIVLRLDQAVTGNLEAALYDLIITYTDADSNRFGVHSDQNARLTYVLEVKSNPTPEVKTSAESTQFTSNGNDEYFTDRFASTAQTFNTDGTNTCAVYTTNFTGKFYAQGTLEQNPTEQDWFSIQLDPESADDEWTFADSSGVIPFTWDGMFQWVRFYYTNDPSNTGTLDKVLYRA